MLAITWEVDGVTVVINSDQETIGYLKFQAGPVKEVGENGLQIEHVIEVLRQRLRRFQQGPFACAENEVAISFLAMALEALTKRTKERELQGVEGWSLPDQSQGAAVLPASSETPTKPPEPIPNTVNEVIPESPSSPGNLPDRPTAVGQ